MCSHTLSATALQFIKGPAATINFFQTRALGGGARGVAFFFGGILLVLFKVCACVCGVTCVV